jgi:hypothetical protein
VGRRKTTRLYLLSILNRVKKFILKTAFFVIPVVLLVVPIIILLYTSGENYTSLGSFVSDEQKGLIGYFYNEQNYNYIKWKAIQVRKKHDVIALGSSRVLQFREEMFDAPFFNAGFTISRISDFKPFLQSLPKDKLPSTIIIGLDQWMFNDAWDIQMSARNNSFWEKSFRFSPSSDIMKSCFLDVFNGKYDITDIQDKSSKKYDLTKIGLNALLNNTGLRNDGSMFYGGQIQKLLQYDSTASDYNFQDTFSRIQNGDRRFQYGSEISPRLVAQLEELLKFCQSNQIYVIGFLPPFANEVKYELDHNSNYLYMKKIGRVAIKYFGLYNFEFWDLTDLSPYYSNDKEVIDGFHGGEVTYIKMLIYMLENNSTLGEYTNILRLRNDLQNRKNRFIVYSY